MRRPRQPGLPGRSAPAPIAGTSRRGSRESQESPGASSQGAHARQSRDHMRRVPRQGALRDGAGLPCWSGSLPDDLYRQELPSSPRRASVESPPPMYSNELPEQSFRPARAASRYGAGSGPERPESVESWGCRRQASAGSPVPCGTRLPLPPPCPTGTTASRDCCGGVPGCCGIR